MKKKTLTPSDLPNKKVKSPDGSFVNMKVVQSDSEHLGEELLAAFRSNVRRIVDERRKRA